MTDLLPTTPTDEVAPMLPARQPWMADAACKGRMQLFFGIAGERPERRVRREARARKVCASCPVIEPCRTMARANGECGFWGGESEEERALAGYPPVAISRRSVQEAATIGLRTRQQAS
jgi:WhiB family redox-sensing transcriptional regulator